VSISTEQIIAITGFVSAVTALAALLISPLVSVYTLRKQINATVLSPSRREWILTLRGHLAELVAILFTVSTKLKVEEDRDLIHQKFERAVYLKSQMMLMMNPLEEDHVRLLALINEATEEFVPEDQDSVKRLNRLIPGIIEAARPILEREWVRVKEGV